MAEENEQENIEEQNKEPEEQTVIDGKVRYNPKKDNQEWKKMLAITIAAFLGGFLAIYFVSDRMNHEKAVKEAAAKNASPFLAKNGTDLSAEDLSEEEQRELEKDRNHKFRVDDYEMTYNDDSDEDDFMAIEKQIKEFEHEQDKIMKRISEEAQLLPVTVSAILEDEIYKITIQAPNYTDEQIKYKISGQNMTVYGKTTIVRDGYEREIEFSNDIFLPAKPKQELIKTYHEGENLIISVPLDID